jgi:hypothetical protein
MGYGGGGSGGGGSGGSGYRRVGDDRTANLKVNNITNRDGSSGTEVDGIVEVNTTAHFIPPSGTTAERGSRGRGVFGGGRASDGSLVNNIEYINIATTGNAKDFGDLTVARRRVTAASSSTRGVFAGGYNPDKDNIDYVTISSTGNAFDFGNLVAATRTMAGLSNEVRALFGSGSIGGGSGVYQDRIDKITIATKGNASNFGNLTVARDGSAPVSSPTRGVLAGGYIVPSRINVMDFVTIATQGNAEDFGDLSVARASAGWSGGANTTRGVFAGGYQNPGSAVDVIDYITIASKGDAIDFGNMTQGFGTFGGASNSIRAVFCGGYGQPANYYANLEYVTIATTGDTTDFGDLTATRASGGSCSDSHGGLG